MVSWEQVPPGYLLLDSHHRATREAGYRPELGRKFGVLTIPSCPPGVNQHTARNKLNVEVSDSIVAFVSRKSRTGSGTMNSVLYGLHGVWRPQKSLQAVQIFCNRSLETYQTQTDDEQMVEASQWSDMSPTMVRHFTNLSLYIPQTKNDLIQLSKRVDTKFDLSKQYQHFDCKRPALVFYYSDATGNRSVNAAPKGIFVKQLANFVAKHNVSSIMVAGNCESTSPGLCDFVAEVFSDALSSKEFDEPTSRPIWTAISTTTPQPTTNLNPNAGRFMLRSKADAVKTTS